MHDDEVLGRAYDARLMRRIWATARPHRGLMALSLAIFPLAAGLELLQPYLVKLAIDDYILARDWVGLGHIAALFAVSLAALYGLRVAQAYVTQLTGQRVIHDLRATLFAHLQSLDARFFDRNPVGRLMTRVLNDVEAINELFTSGVVSIFGDVLMLTGVVVIMLGMNWKLALVAFALAPVLAVLGLYFRVRARRSYREVRIRLARLNAYLQESLTGMTVIQLFAREASERETFGRLNEDLRRAQFRSTFYDASFYAMVETMGSAAVALVLWYGGGEILRGALTFGGLVAFLEYLARAFMPLRDLGNKYTVMQAAMVSAERIFGLLDTAPAVANPPSAARLPGPAPAGTPAIEFKRRVVRLRRRAVGAARLLVPRGSGRAGRARGADGRGQDDDRAADDAGLRRHARAGAGRGPRRARVGPHRAPAARGAGAAGDLPLERHGRGELDPRPRRARERLRGRAGGGGGECGTAHRDAARRARRGSPRARRQSVAGAAPAPGHRASAHL